MVTVGLDFGTHQTKVCIERKEGVELSYHFLTFKDTCGREQYALPSIIQKKSDGRLAYGFVSKHEGANIVRYFKQAAFHLDTDAIFHSVWYLSYIIFDLEERYGTDFCIQMGAPTDGAHLNERRMIATSLVLSAYNLVEEVFHNDKQKFLDTEENKLIQITNIIPFSQEKKEEYSILVFPEAYACLKPLTASSRIPTGMSLMVDIGGGTTDISFFTIEENEPVVYDFTSIDKGLNYLTSATTNTSSERVDSNVQNENEIKAELLRTFKDSINQVCGTLIGKLRKEFQNQCKLDMHRLQDALKHRPLIYTGGGSTFSILRGKYFGFTDVMHVSYSDWQKGALSKGETINHLGLCPILSTAYGLAIHAKNDKIKSVPLSDVFKEIRGYEEDESDENNRSQINTGYSNYDRIMNKDYGCLNYTPRKRKRKK